MTRISTVRPHRADMLHLRPTALATGVHDGIALAALVAFTVMVVLWADALFGRG